MSIASEPVKECRLSADRPGKELHKSQRGSGRVRTTVEERESRPPTNKRLQEGGVDASVPRLTRGARRVAKSFAEHVRGRDLQTLPLRFNCCQIFQLCSPELFWFALFPFISTSNGQRRHADRKESGGRDERRPRREPGSPMHILMGIISFYLRQLSLRSILIWEQRSAVPSKENVCF